MTAVFYVSLAGLVVAFYALYLDYMFEKNPEFKPVCDLSDTISCGKNFGNKKVRILGIPSSVLMLAYFIPMIILAYYDYVYAALAVAIFGVIASLYKEYRIVTIAKVFCLVCNLFFAFTFLLFYLVWRSL